MTPKARLPTVGRPTMITMPTPGNGYATVLIDYIVPQVYFSSEFGRAPYKSLVDWWTQNCINTNCQLYIGHGAYRVGRGSERDPGWWRQTEFPNQIRYNRDQQLVQGSVLFSARNLKLNPLAIRDSLQTNFYRHIALAPTMPWLDSIPPLPPYDLKVATTPEGIELFWQQAAEAVDGDAANGYLVYRFEGQRPRLRLDDPRCIVAHCIGEETTRYIDKTADPAKKYVYAITALDRLNNESREGNSKGKSPTLKLGFSLLHYLFHRCFY